MVRRLIPAFVSVLAVGALGAGVAHAGQGGLGITPDPVTAGSSVTASGICPTSSEFVTVSFTVTLTAGGFTDLSSDIPTDPQSGAFSGTIAIPAGASAQTVAASAECFDTSDGTIITGTSGASFDVIAAPPQTDAPTTTSGVGSGAGLPDTGSSSSGLLLAVGLCAVALGAVLVPMRRRAHR